VGNHERAAAVRGSKDRAYKAEALRRDLGDTEAEARAEDSLSVAGSLLVGLCSDRRSHRDDVSGDCRSVLGRKIFGEEDCVSESGRDHVLVGQTMAARGNTNGCVLGDVDLWIANVRALDPAEEVKRDRRRLDRRKTCLSVDDPEIKMICSVDALQ